MDTTTCPTTKATSSKAARLTNRLIEEHGFAKVWNFVRALETTHAAGAGRILGVSRETARQYKAALGVEYRAYQAHPDVKALADE